MDLVNPSAGRVPATLGVYTDALARKVSEGRFDGPVRSVGNVFARLKVFVSDGSKAAAIVHAMQHGDLARLGAFKKAADTKRGDVVAALGTATKQQAKDRLRFYRMNQAFSKSPGLSREASKGAARQREERNDAWNDLCHSTFDVDCLNQKLSRCDVRASLIQACLERVSNRIDAH